MTPNDRSAELDALVARWRAHLRAEGDLSEDAVDELESHLLDEVDRLTARGLPPRPAFFEAAARLGHADGLRSEYRKLREAPVHEPAWRRALRGPALAASYVRVGVRTLRRHRGYALTNLLGLAVGLAVCLVIGLFVRHKLAYDRHLPNADHVFRIYTDDPAGVNMPPGLGQVLDEQYPEIRSVTAVWAPSRRLITVEGEQRHLEGVAMADEHFLEVFPYRVLARGERDLLAAPEQIVLTRSTAEGLFGTADVLGRTLNVENRADYTVVAVIEDPPAATHLPFNALVSMDAGTRETRYGSGVKWNWYSGALYLALREGTDATALEAKIRAWETGSRAAVAPTSYDEADPQLRLMPATDIHLHGRFERDVAPQSDVRYVYLFSVAAVLILLLACVNYMNLATARSAGRAREVGVRKAVGAHRGQLVGQFLSESLVLALLALPLALLMAWLALPLVERIAGTDVSLSLLDDPVILVALVAVVLGVGLVAGTYPAFFLSRFRAAHVLVGGSRSGGRRGVLLRRALVVVQFAATVVLLVGTIAVQRQLDYLQNKRLGFDTEAVLIFDLMDGARDRYTAFRTALAATPSVAAAAAGDPLGFGWRSMMVAHPVDPAHPDGEQQYVDVVSGDYGYLETLGIRPVAGRTFDAVRGDAPENTLILTRSTLALFGLTDDAVGQPVDFAGARPTLVGVVEDLHNESLHKAALPTAIQLELDQHYTMLVRLRPGDLRQGVDEVAAVWRQFVPERPFEVEFLDDRIAAQYEAEERLGRVFVVFSLLAVFVACLGLFGLAAFTAEQRTKEIGVRKVLGASAASIVLLLSREYARLVAIAFVLAAPPAYLLARRWLEDFAYRIDLSPLLVGAAGALALLVALLATGYQAVRASRANPVHALRYE